MIHDFRIKRVSRLVLLGFLIAPLYGFEYQPLPEGNLIKNPWFYEHEAGKPCKWSGEHWEVNVVQGNSWDLSDKTQDPIDKFCAGNSSDPEDWVGFAMRWARQSGNDPDFVPDADAMFWQIVGPVSPEHTKLNFHFLMVFHRMTQFRARILGSNNGKAPWTEVWTPIDSGWLQTEGANGPGDCNDRGPEYAQFPEGNRDCLWDIVTEKELGACPRTTTIETGYPYYKVEFLGNYPQSDGSATGDVGGKIARVFFSVSPHDAPDMPGFCGYQGGINDDNNDAPDAGVPDDGSTPDGNDPNNPALSSKSGGCHVTSHTSGIWSAMWLLFAVPVLLFGRRLKPVRIFR